MVRQIYLYTWQTCPLVTDIYFRVKASQHTVNTIIWMFRLLRKICRNTLLSSFSMTLPSPLMGRGARASWRSFTKFSTSCHQLLQRFAMKFRTPKWTTSFFSAQTATTRRKSSISDSRGAPQDYASIPVWKIYEKERKRISFNLH